MYFVLITIYVLVCHVPIFIKLLYHAIWWEIFDNNKLRKFCGFFKIRKIKFLENQFNTVQDGRLVGIGKINSANFRIWVICKIHYPQKTVIQ